MLLTIEKVIILKSVSIFSDIPEETLAEVSLIMEEMIVAPGKSIVTKGDVGRSMYIIIDGKVQVHDQNREIAVLGEREIFGELAALSPEPRMASVTAIDETHLFRIDYETLQDLISENPDLAQGIIQVLCNRIRSLSKVR